MGNPQKAGSSLQRIGACSQVMVVKIARYHIVDKND